MFVIVILDNEGRKGRWIGRETWIRLWLRPQRKEIAGPQLDGLSLLHICSARRHSFIHSFTHWISAYWAPSVCFSHCVKAGRTVASKKDMVLAFKCPWSSKGDSEWPGPTVQCENARIKEGWVRWKPREGTSNPQMKGEASAKLSLVENNGGW